MNDTVVTVVGTVVTELRCAHTEEGLALATFRLATNPRRYDRGSGAWANGPTSYYAVTCWRSLADNVASSVHKGDPVVVTGRLRVREWEAGGRTGVTADVEATSVGHDLSRGRSRFERSGRTSPARVAAELATEALLAAHAASGPTAGPESVPTSGSDPGEGRQDDDRSGAAVA